MNAPKTVQLGVMLTEQQLQRCLELYPDRERILAEVVAPNMAAINRKLGQENDATYLSYAIVHVLGQYMATVKGSN